MVIADCFKFTKGRLPQNSETTLTFSWREIGLTPEGSLLPTKLLRVQRKHSLITSRPLFKRVYAGGGGVTTARFRFSFPLLPLFCTRSAFVFRHDQRQCYRVLKCGERK